MSLFFSRIQVKIPGGDTQTFFEGTSPDEADARELFKRDQRFAGLGKLLERHSFLDVKIQHYRFSVKGSDALADESHFALIEAYDALAKRHGKSMFINRSDVEPLDRLRFRLISNE